MLNGPDSQRAEFPPGYMQLYLPACLQTLLGSLCTHTPTHTHTNIHMHTQTHALPHSLYLCRTTKTTQPYHKPICVISSTKQTTAKLCVCVCNIEWKDHTRPFHCLPKHAYIHNITQYKYESITHTHISVAILSVQ